MAISRYTTTKLYHYQLKAGLRGTYMHKIVLYILLLFCCATVAQTRVAGVPSQWVLMNGTQANQWHIGTATSNGGYRSLYISYDNGTNNNYNYYSSSCVWACRPIYLTPGRYSVTYDWHSKGNMDNAFMRAYLVPSGAFLSSSGAGNHNGLYPHASPAGWISLSDEFCGNDMMVDNPTWRHLHIPSINITTADTYYLAFGWKNTSSSIPGQPPAAVDDIHLDSAPCPLGGIGFCHTMADGIQLLTDFRQLVRSGCRLVEHNSYRRYN